MLNLCKRVNILLLRVYYRQIRDSINQISRYDFKLILNNILHYSVPCRQENVTKERSIRGKTCSPSLSREGVISKFRQRFECDWNCMSCMHAPLMSSHTDQLDFLSIFTVKRQDVHLTSIKKGRDFSALQP